jgi:ribosomal protein L6P/L9E
MESFLKSKRFNIVFNNEYLSCNGPWGLRVQRHLNKYYVKDKFIFLKKKRHYRQFINFIGLFLKNVLNGWFARLRFEGFGYKFKLFFRKLRVYLGHCHNIDLLLPPGIICLKDKKRKHHILFYSLDLSLLKTYVLLLKNFRRLNNYKFLGVLYARQKEGLKLKPGKQQFR